MKLNKLSVGQTLVVSSIKWSDVEYQLPYIKDGGELYGPPNKLKLQEKFLLSRGYIEGASPHFHLTVKGESALKAYKSSPRWKKDNYDRE